MNEKNAVVNVTETGKPSGNNAVKVSSRRKFLGQVGAALAGGAVLGKAAVASAQEYNRAVGDTNAVLDGVFDPRVRQSFTLRLEAATRDALIPVPPHTTNGDEARYPDKSGTYTKGVLQDGIGLVNPSAFQTLRHAIDTGTFAAFESVILGGTRTLNGPLAGNAFSLEGCDVVQFGSARSPATQIRQVVVPPAPALASAAYGTELVELYWASLLRDVAFTDYASNPTAAQAAAELDTMPVRRPEEWIGSRHAGPVVPRTLPRRNRWALHVSVASHPHLLRYAADQPAARHLLCEHRLHD